MAECKTTKSAPKTTKKSTASKKKVEIVNAPAAIPCVQQTNDPRLESKRKILFVASEARPFIATGGLAKTIIKHVKHEITVDENLVLKGLNIIFNKNN